jgi:hypothetical protein
MRNNYPYSDEKLHEIFIWTKKLEKEGLSDVVLQRLQEITKRRVQENQVK